MTSYYDPADRRRITLPDPPVTARVVRVEGAGATARGWAVPIDAEIDTPVGPCYLGAPAVAGDLVLLVYTDAGPWVVARQLS